MVQVRVRSFAAVAGLVVAGAALAGCGGSSGSGHAGGLRGSAGAGSGVSTSEPATSVPASSTTVAAGTDPISGTTLPAPAACATGSLSVALADIQGAAGSTVSHLTFTNRGTASCSIGGYPGVSLVAGASGTRIGAAATRSGVAPVHTLTLQPGQAAVAELRQADAGDFPSATCHPTPTRGFRVYPPNSTDAAFVAHPGQGCSNPSLGQSQLFVGPVTPGTAAPAPSAGMSSGPSGAGPVLVVRSFDGSISYDGREPTTIALSGDSTNIVSHLEWSSWGQEGAVGHGQLGLDNCDPNCAQGHVTQVSATVELGTVVSGRYTTMTEKAGSILHRYTYPSDWATSAS